MWYQPYRTDPLSKWTEGQPLAATIAHVNTDGTINVGVLAVDGRHAAAPNVVLVQEGETPPAGVSYCEWMPYQKGQAAKAEKAEADLHEARRMASTGEPLIDMAKYPPAASGVDGTTGD